MFVYNPVQEISYNVMFLMFVFSPLCSKFVCVPAPPASGNDADDGDEGDVRGSVASSCPPPAAGHSRGWGGTTRPGSGSGSASPDWPRRGCFAPDQGGQGGEKKEEQEICKEKERISYETVFNYQYFCSWFKQHGL